MFAKNGLPSTADDKFGLAAVTRGVAQRTAQGNFIVTRLTAGTHTVVDTLVPCYAGTQVNGSEGFMLLPGFRNSLTVRNPIPHKL